MNIPKHIMSKQVRLKCLDCSENSFDYVKFCSTLGCPLWFLRFGTYPKTYIRRHGEKAKLLFDEESFKDGKIFGSRKTTNESKKEYNKL